MQTKATRYSQHMPAPDLGGEGRNTQIVLERKKKNPFPDK